MTRTQAQKIALKRAFADVSAAQDLISGGQCFGDRAHLEAFPHVQAAADTAEEELQRLRAAIVAALGDHTVCDAPDGCEREPLR